MPSSLDIWAISFLCNDQQHERRRCWLLEARFAPPLRRRTDQGKDCPDERPKVLGRESGTFRLGDKASQTPSRVALPSLYNSWPKGVSFGFVEKRKEAHSRISPTTNRHQKRLCIYMQLIMRKLKRSGVGAELGVRNLHVTSVTVCGPPHSELPPFSPFLDHRGRTTTKTHASRRRNGGRDRLDVLVRCNLDEIAEKTKVTRPSRFGFLGTSAVMPNVIIA